MDQWKIMLQKLLGERCKLSFHHDRKEMAVYILSVGKTGPKLAPSPGNAMGLPGLGFRGRVGGDVSAFNATIGDFINFMTRNVKLDRPMIDRTGISGRYDFTLDWTPDDSQFNGTGGKLVSPAESPSTLPSLYTAVQEQLGLRLEATRAAADVLVIDRVEKPSENQRGPIAAHLQGLSGDTLVQINPSDHCSCLKSSVAAGADHSWWK